MGLKCIKIFAGLPKKPLVPLEKNCNLQDLFNPCIPTFLLIVNPSRNILTLFSSSDRAKENRKKVLRNQRQGLQKQETKGSLQRAEAEVNQGHSFTPNVLPANLNEIPSWWDLNCIHCQQCMHCLAKWEPLLCVSHACPITACWMCMLERGR